MMNGVDENPTVDTAVPVTVSCPAQATTPLLTPSSFVLTFLMGKY